jgi:long-subunit fatty acid transport protein
MRTYHIPLCIFFISLFIYADFAAAQKIHIASSPNPVGSGARALGMGGAFIAAADDATAASWNPGGLVQLKWSEVSAAGNWFCRTEDNRFGKNPEADGSRQVSESDLNYLSAAYPFNLFSRNMIVSLNYQHLYDFTREWEHSVITASPEFEALNQISYRQDGSLSAIGFAYCIQIVPKLSAGVTLNFWKDGLARSKWDEKTHSLNSQTLKAAEGISSPVTSSEEYNWHDRYTFDGFNFNLGMLWRITDRLTLGWVFKSPFTADLNHEESVSERKLTFTGEMQNNSEEFSNDAELEMPMSCGLGIAYRFSDSFTLSADIYRTEWQDFIFKNSDENEISPVTGKSADESDVDPTHQIRIGAEYLFVNQESDYVIPLRAGIFYDPMPADGSPDSVYGISIGSGFVRGRYAFDIACQYRFGNDAGHSAAPVDYDFSQDISEFSVYSSLIIHFR